MRMLSCVVILALLSGCALLSKRRVTWNHPTNETEESFHRDFTACEALSPYRSGHVDEDFIFRCMRGKQWTTTTEFVKGTWPVAS